jgi:hypothetical protein
VLPRDSRIAFAPPTSAALPGSFEYGCSAGSTTSLASRSSGRRRRARQRVDALEVSGLPQVGAQPLVQLLRHLVGVALELLGTILGELRDRRLRRVPEARTILIEVRRRRREPPQRVAEHGRRLSRHHATELHAAILETAVRRRRRGRRAEVDRARDASRRVQLAEVRLVGVDLERQRVGPSTSFSMIGAQLSER